jgi:hypothetical protein
MKLSQVDKMKYDAVCEYLKELIAKLDELDGEDFFGTEGWRHFIMGED